MKQFLFKQIDNSSLVVFRIIFGLLCFLESVGAIFTGWVKRVMIEPEFTFSFIGFEWLQPLPGYWMYVYYVVMGIFGLGIMLGYKYRVSTVGFTLMWSAVYLMQKSAYNNHYYLLMLLSAVMVFLPAHYYASIDAKQNPNLKKGYMPQWCRWLIISLLFIIYTYASLAKFYPDWLNYIFIKNLMAPRAHFPIVGDLLQQHWVHVFLTYGGILFDGLVIPLLLFKPTRKFAFISAIFFHLFNSFVLHIGIFPYLALAFSLFFFESKIIQSIFLKSKLHYDKAEVIIPKHANLITAVMVVFLLINIALPLRHHFFKDDVLWTEEGHRLSWRMMLRSKSGRATYKVVDKNTNETTIIKLSDFITEKQKKGVCSKPDMIWQFAQHLKQHYAKQGKDIAVYVDCFISVNRRPQKRLIDPKVDLASLEWSHFEHSEWVLRSNFNED